MKMRKNGFTLVEVLIVIAIIAVLATLGITNFSAASKKARDSVRKSDLSAINQALVLYRSDRGNYPAVSGQADVVLDISAVAANKLTPTYIREVPKAPNAVGVYNYVGAAKQFTLCTKLEMPTGNYKLDSGAVPSTSQKTCENVAGTCTPGVAGNIANTSANKSDGTNGCCFCVFSP
jgi:general secretion pathway protein G